MRTSYSYLIKPHSPAEVFTTFLKLGLITFGGPVAHLGYFRDELVVRRQWVNQSQFSQLIAICQFLPGPSSSQLGFSLGLIRGGWLGALAAFLGFTLPAALLMLAFATLLPVFSSTEGQAISHGLNLVACVVVADAVLSMSRVLCPDWLRKSIAMLATALALAGTPGVQFLVIIFGVISGISFCRIRSTEIWADMHVNYRIKTAGLLVLIVFSLFAGLFFVSPTQADLWSVARVFYQTGSLVFGGGHVVLPLLENAVVDPGWISRTDFFTGYGLAQCMPGPLFTFSAYLGALIPTGQNPLLGAVTALLSIFLPGLLLIAAALPVWRKVSQYATARNAIAGINAAVVGMLAAALYNPIFTSAIQNGYDLTIALVAFLLLSSRRMPIAGVVLWCIGLTVIFRLLYT